MNTLDRIVTQLDQALRVSLAPAPAADRESPGGKLPEASLEHDERELTDAGLSRRDRMRPRYSMFAARNL